MASQMLAGYEVLSTLGYGARSSIYKVRDPKTDEFYALKRVGRELAKDERYMEQVVNEYEIGKAISHPCVRKCHKLIRERSFLKLTEVFLVMELIEGQTLEQVKGKDLVRFCRICQDAVIGLGVMHEHGYVHADVKPNNVLVTADGRVKVIDLGQSCKVGTVKQRIQGTPDYIAPEQVKRRELTAQTDIFGVGAMLYWLLTDKHIPSALKTNKTGEIRAAKVVEPPHQLNSEIPLALSTLVMQCVSKRMSDRPISMGQLYERMELAISQLS